MKSYYCEECNEVVLPNEEMSIHTSMTGHKWYTPKDLADRGFYGWDDRVNADDLPTKIRDDGWKKSKQL
jgi:hypothetical protein